MQRHKLQQRKFWLYINFFTMIESNTGTGLPESLQHPPLCRQSKPSWTQPWATWAKLALLWAHRWDHGIYSGPFQPKSCYRLVYHGNILLSLWSTTVSPLQKGQVQVYSHRKCLMSLISGKISVQLSRLTLLPLRSPTHWTSAFCRCLSHSCNLWPKRRAAHNREWCSR